MLVGAVNGEMYSAFKTNAGIDIAARLTVFPTPAGAAYGVVTCQLGVHQHRFVHPLFNSKVVELLASATTESLNIYLESAGELREGMLYDCLLTPEQFMPAEAMSRALDHRKLKNFINELPSVISEMLTLNLVPSLNAEDVCKVDVSILLPRDEIEGHFAKVGNNIGGGSYCH